MPRDAPPEPIRTIRLLPADGARVALLMLLTVLALVQIGAGVTVAEAWRAGRQLSSPLPSDLARLDELWWRLRSLEQAVAIGVVALATMWSFVALVNAHRAGSAARRAVVGAIAWLLPLASVLVLAAQGVADRPDHWRWATVAVPVVLVGAPLHVVAGGAAALGGGRLSFQRLHLVIAVAFALHQVGTRPVDLTDTGAPTDLGRLAILHVTTGLMLTLVVLAAADATRGLQALAEARVERYRASEENAALRFRLHTTAGAAPGWTDA